MTTGTTRILENLRLQYHPEAGVSVLLKGVGFFKTVRHRLDNTGDAMNLNVKRFVVGLSLLVCVAMVTGCGPKADTSGRPATVPAGGTVTYNGAAVADASVTLVPEQDGKAAVAKTDANGKFSLMTFEPEDGAVPGTYKVTIVKRTEAPEEVSEDSEGASAPPPEDLLPTKYGSASESELTAEVTDGGENQFTFDLTD